MALKTPPPEVQVSLLKLSTAAKTLNELSDQLTKEVSEVELTVNRLNLGVSTHVQFESWGTEDGSRSGVWRLAYGKFAGKWGFFVEHVAEDLNLHPDDTNEYEAWLFKDAPREKRLKAVESIPLLLAALVKKADEVASQINDKVVYAKDLSSKLAQPSRDGSSK